MSDFITTYFNSNDSTSKSGRTQYDIKKIDLKSIRFEQNDQWTGSYMKASVVSLVADCKKINSATGFIKLGTISLDQPSFVMKVIPALQPKGTKETNTPATKTNPLNIHIPKYWKLAGRMNETYFRGIAISGTESVYMIDEAKPTP